MTWDRLHDEDVLYEYRGDDPADLIAGRFYLGTVDGFADFGVFIDLGDGVTGLLHRSQLDRRLESLDWEVGEEVIVQVEDVRDNGNIDLAWSIRQSEREFRGHDIHDPNGASTPEEQPSEEPPSQTVADVAEEEPVRPASAAPAVGEASDAEVVTPPERVPIEETTDLEGRPVRLEGRVTNVRQTSGPTIFELTDETDVIDCAAFEAPGVRAYESVAVNDVVRIDGEVQRHQDSLQVEVANLEELHGDDAETVVERLDAAVAERAAPREVALLVEEEPIASMADQLEAVATTLRRAAIEARPVVIRHPPTVDGYVGAAAIEHALHRAIGEEHEEAQAADGLVDRRPMRSAWYDLGDAFFDIPSADDEDSPLLVLVGAGTTAEDRQALDLAGLYGVERVVIDSRSPEPGEVAADFVVAPPGGVEHRVTASTFAANLAALAANHVRPELFHLPAISYWGRVPEPYDRIARDNGFDEATVTERREAIALIAYYQQFDGKRQLVRDLLFDGQEAGELAAHVSRQYREKIETAVTVADANREQISVPGGRVTFLDTETLQHPREFPPTRLLLGELQEQWGPLTNEAIAAIGRDELFVVGPAVDLNGLATELSEAVPDAGIEARRDHLTFLAGKRDEIRGALVEALAADFV